MRSMLVVVLVTLICHPVQVHAKPKPKPKPKPEVVHSNMTERGFTPDGKLVVVADGEQREMTSRKVKVLRKGLVGILVCEAQSAKSAPNSRYHERSDCKHICKCDVNHPVFCDEDKGYPILQGLKSLAGLRPLGKLQASRHIYSLAAHARDEDVVGPNYQFITKGDPVTLSGGRKIRFGQLPPHTTSMEPKLDCIPLEMQKAGSTAWKQVFCVDGSGHFTEGLGEMDNSVEGITLEPVYDGGSVVWFKTTYNVRLQEIEDNLDENTERVQYQGVKLGP